MYASEALNNNSYEEIRFLINNGSFSSAEAKLNSIDAKDAEWHFLYSSLLIAKAWFDTAKMHLEKAIEMAPDHEEYKESLANLMARYRRYRDDYYDGPYRRRHQDDCCCCCCDDCCCHVSCCDLICLDTCCECMGGDFIECI